MTQIKVSMMFVHPTMAHARMRDSIVKYIPEGFKYIDYVWTDTIIKERPDIVISHYGYSTYQPFLAFITPKAVITELVTPQIISYFTEKDIVAVYEPEKVDFLRDAGINAILWPRPVDPQIFYRQNIEKDIDVVISSIHSKSIVESIVGACADFDKSCVVLSRNPNLPGVKDYCDGDTDKLRSYYNRAKYIFSLVPACRYGLNNEYVTHGFEVSYVEGMFCGATPVVIDAPTGEYLKYWYGDYAKWIREDSLKEDLYCLLSSDYEPLPKSLIEKAVDRYNARDVWAKLFDAIKQAR